MSSFNNRADTVPVGRPCLPAGRQAWLDHAIERVPLWVVLVGSFTLAVLVGILAGALFT